MLAETAFHRQLDVFPPAKAKTPITLIGCGGIGSVTALCLAKIGCENITTYDDDTVETHNLPSQLFTPEQVGQLKVEALHKTVYAITDTATTRIPYQFGESEGQEVSFTPIMISAVDSMDVRQSIYNILKTRFDINLYIEARMSAESMRIYAIQPTNPDHQKFYEANLYSDSEASPETCTAKAIAYNTFIIGGLIASLVKKHMMGEEVPRELIFNLQLLGFHKTI
jgi:hypothetical protein